MSELLTTKEALAVLTLNNHRFLKYLNERGLLPRLYVGPRSIRYRMSDCLALLEMAEKKGITLTCKP